MEWTSEGKDEDGMALYVWIETDIFFICTAKIVISFELSPDCSENATFCLALVMVSML